jgi:hypothetical protein
VFLNWRMCFTGNRQKAGRLRVGRARERAARHHHGSSPTHSGSEVSGSQAGSVSQSVSGQRTAGGGVYAEKRPRRDAGLIPEAEDESPTADPQATLYEAASASGGGAAGALADNDNSERARTVRFMDEGSTATAGRSSGPDYAPLSTTAEISHPDGPTELSDALANDREREEGKSPQDRGQPQGEDSGIEMV